MTAGRECGCSAPDRPPGTPLIRTHGRLRAASALLWLAVLGLLVQVETQHTPRPHFPASLSEPAGLSAPAQPAPAPHSHSHGAGSHPGARHDGSLHDCSVCQALQHGFSFGLASGGAPPGALGPLLLPASAPAERLRTVLTSAGGGARAPPSRS